MAAVYGTFGILAFIGLLAGFGLVWLVDLVMGYFLNRISINNH